MLIGMSVGIRKYTENHASVKKVHAKCHLN